MSARNVAIAIIPVRTMPAAVKALLPVTELPRALIEIASQLKRFVENKNYDEIKAMSDKAATLAFHAKQVNDTTLFDYARRVQNNALRAYGDLLTQMNRRRSSYERRASHAGPLPIGRQHIARRLAAIPKPRFEEELSVSPVPSPSAIVARYRSDAPGSQRETSAAWKEIHSALGPLYELARKIDAKRFSVDLTDAEAMTLRTGPMMKAALEWLDELDRVISRE